MKLHKPHIIKRNGLWQVKIKHKAATRTFKPASTPIEAWMNRIDKVKA